MAHTIEERIAIEDIYGMTVEAAIEVLRTALAEIPEEFRNVATLSADDYYEGGIDVIRYERGMNAEEIAKSDALLADRAALIEATSAADMAEWIRFVRLHHNPPGMMGMALSAEEALAALRNSSGWIECHPKYDRATKTILL